MLCKIENYLIDVDNIRDLSVCYNENGVYHYFKRTEYFRCEEGNSFCIVIDFNTKTSDDDYEEIQIDSVDTSEAFDYFDKLCERIADMSHNSIGKLTTKTDLFEK